MEEGKKKNIIIAILTVIIVILAVLCVLFATGTISFKSNSTDNGNITENDIHNSQQTIRYYQYYTEHDYNDSNPPVYTSRELELNTDGTTRFRFGGNGSGGESYKGTYTEDDNKVVLTLEVDRKEGFTCDENTALFPCKATITLTKNNDGTITSTNELGIDSYSYVYSLVDKSNFKLFSEPPK